MVTLPPHARARVHVHVPHELSESEHGERVSGRERGSSLAAVLLLSLATLGITWSGYQRRAVERVPGAGATRQASTARAQANRASTLGGQERIQDLLNFNRWLEEDTNGDQKLADLYVRRFRPEFRPAFQAWLAQDPLNNPKAIATPLLVPQYKLANLEKADRLEAIGDHRFQEGKDATEQRRHAYIFATVFFATVLVLRRHLDALRVGPDALDGARARVPVVRLRRRQAARAPTH